MLNTKFAPLRYRLLLLVLVWPMSAMGATIQALSPSFADVSAALAAASAGDTIVLPPGRATWTQTLDITKAVSIVGSGAQRTILTTGSDLPNGFFYFHGISTSSVVRITGVKFDLINWTPKYAIVIDDVDLRNLRIDHNLFNQGGVAQIWVTGSHGVIDHNYFYNSNKAISFSAGSSAQAQASWESLAAGTGDALFIEDNHFIDDANYSATYGNEKIGTYNGGKLVVRHNIFDAKNYPLATTFYTIMTHGSALGGAHSGDASWGYWQRDPSTSGARRGQSVVEIYDNVMEGKRIDSLAILRGASNLVYNNSVTLSAGYTPSILLREEEFTESSNWNPLRRAWPAEDQVHNTFIWNNTYNGSPILADAISLVPNDPAPDEKIKLNRDYFLHAPQASGGSEAFVCAKGVASCNGAAGSFPTDGITYPTLGTMVFTAHGANAYYPYRPYSYPHPLTVGNTLNATSCSFADVQAAVALATEGDTVHIPAGVCTWSAGNQLVIDKSLSVIGAGTGSGPSLTKIIHSVLDDDSAAAPATFNINLTTDMPVRISGIYFDKGSNVRGPAYPNLYRQAIFIRSPKSNSSPLTQVRIDHNYFNWGVNSIFSVGYVYALVDSNYFLNPNTAIFIVGDDSDSWSRPITAGSKNSFFIEGNTFILDNGYGNGSSNEMIYPQQGARVVVRYNTYNATLYSRDDTPPFCTSHPNWSGTAPYYETYRGQPLYEVYNNDISISASYNSMISFRGGSELVHDNTITKAHPSSEENSTSFTEEEGWTVSGLWCYAYWTVSTSYTSGARIQPTHYNGYYYQVSSPAGWSGGVEPSWPLAINGTAIDGSLIWTNMGKAPCPVISAWPANDQVTSSFVWNNYLNGSPNSKVSLPHTRANGEGYDDVIIQQDRDYFLHEPRASGGRTYYLANSQCSGQATPAPCCSGAGTGKCAAGHYDALVFSPSGPNSYFPYTPYTCPHPLSLTTGHCNSSATGAAAYNVATIPQPPANLRFASSNP